MSSCPSVLIVDNAVHPLLFKPAWHWKAHLMGVETQTVNAPSGEGFPPPGRFTHVILTGSEASILRPKPWFQSEATWIQEAVELGVPVLGSCFGHQMLVLALSGPEHLARSEPPEVGWARIERTGSDPLFDHLPDPWSTFVYHFDEVVDPPPPWRKIGRSAHCDTHLLRYDEKPVWGVQAHPEISSRRAKLFLRLTVLAGLKPARHVLHALRHVPPRNDVADTVLERFLAI